MAGKKGSRPCPGYQAFVHHVAELVQAMSQFLRANRALAELMGAYARQDTQPGCNDPCPRGGGRKWKRCHGAPLTLVTAV